MTVINPSWTHCTVERLFNVARYVLLSYVWVYDFYSTSAPIHLNVLRLLHFFFYSSLCTHKYKVSLDMSNVLITVVYFWMFQFISCWYKYLASFNLDYYNLHCPKNNQNLRIKIKNRACQTVSAGDWRGYKRYMYGFWEHTRTYYTVQYKVKKLNINHAFAPTETG